MNEASERERLLSGVPVKDLRFSLAGVSTAVLDGGDGPAVVLLHSSGEFGALWARVIPDLARTHRVFVPDLPGHGASGLPAGGLDADRMLDWLGELIDLTCPAPPVLIGHGLGGAVAARFAVAHGARVARLVLVDTMGLAPFEPAASFGMALQGFLQEPTETTRDGLFRQCFVDLDGLRAEVGEQWASIASYALAGARTPDQQAALAALMPSYGMAVIPAADLDRIAAPTALIWGRHDLQVPLAVAETIAARHGWPLHVIEDAGDDPALEQPRAFLTALRLALAAAPVGSR